MNSAMILHDPKSLTTYMILESKFLHDFMNMKSLRHDHI